MKQDHFFTCSCRESTAELITDMVERARRVTLRTIRKHCAHMKNWEHGMGYATGREKGLRLKNDWAVSFHKSRYDGRPCYYIDHSRIEHVWTRQE